jgi:hypothetical protein
MAALPMSDLENEQWWSIPQGFEDQAKMATMLKGSLETNYMLLVIGICLHELVDYLNFFHSSFEPAS